MLFLAFSLSQWLTSKDLPTNTEPVPTNALYELLDTLSISRFLEDTPCDPTTGIYAGALNGWKNGTDCYHTQHTLSKEYNNALFRHYHCMSNKD